MYLYHSTCFLDTFFNHGNYKKLEPTTEQYQQTKAAQNSSNKQKKKQRNHFRVVFTTLFLINIVIAQQCG